MAIQGFLPITRSVLAEIADAHREAHEENVRVYHNSLPRQLWADVFTGAASALAVPYGLFLDGANAVGLYVQSDD